MPAHDVAVDADSPAPGSWRQPAVVLGLIGVGGLLAGALRGVEMEIVSRVHRSDGQSGLIVPLVSGPILLAVGWTMLVLWSRADRRWPIGGPVVVLLGIPWLLLARVLLPAAYQTLRFTWGVVPQILMMGGLPLVEGVGGAVLFARRHPSAPGGWPGRRAPDGARAGGGGGAGPDHPAAGCAAHRGSALPESPSPGGRVSRAPGNARRWSAHGRQSDGMPITTHEGSTEWPATDMAPGAVA